MIITKTSERRPSIFTIRAGSHPHGAIVTGVSQPGGQRLRVKRGPILFETIQEKTHSPVVDLETEHQNEASLLC